MSRPRKNPKFVFVRNKEESRGYDDPWPNGRKPLLYDVADNILYYGAACWWDYDSIPEHVHRAIEKKFKLPQGSSRTVH